MSGFLSQMMGSFLSNPQVGQALPGILSQLLHPSPNAPGGGLQGLLQQLQSAGLGEQVQSWIGDGPNKPVSPEELGNALPPDQVQSMAQQAGTTPESLLQMLAHALPHAVDQATPNGEVPPPDAAPPNYAALVGSLFSR